MATATSPGPARAARRALTHDPEVREDGASSMRPLDIDRLRAIARDEREAFASAAPFPHLVVDDFLPADTAGALVRELAATRGDWIFYHHVNERKRGFNDLARMGPATRAVIDALQAPAAVTALGALAGEPALRADPSLEGGGLAEMEPGGYVNVHADFLSHPHEPSWTRRLNLVLFLNDGWTEDDGGMLELWDADVRGAIRRIVPAFNRCAIFATSATSFHAVPAVRCAPGRSRKSLALYYFVDEGTPRPVRSTRYVPRPGDPLGKRVLIHLDRLALRAYALVKRHTPFGDRLVSRLLEKL